MLFLGVLGCFLLICDSVLFIMCNFAMKMYFLLQLEEKTC